ncbi:hypothetical protein Mterra_02961 [Calidithermus terrae]|uniref:Uncharacterized protein n=1 Tax=Calidithermus terrae TaxID=1408545 RepID=A0A399EE39_9DEIN|nr:hypothetical protein Mterra_02961 [Calidithermus terrae]
MLPSSSYQAGIWWPHHNCRPTAQSRMFSSQSRLTFSQRSGTKRISPLSRPASTFSATGFIRTNHCVSSIGSMGSLVRSERGSCTVWVSTPLR